MIVICTKAGKYDIALNGWTEPLQFSEPGIYFMDSRANWGGKYVESLFRSGTDVPEETEENPAEYNGNEIQMFTKGLCIGDSITEGVFNYSDGQTVIKKYSYPSVLKRITGIDVVNAGVGGLTAKTWYEASIDSNTQYGRWVNNEWVWHASPETAEGDVVSEALDYSGYDFAVIHLGINDIYLMGEATLDETISTFEANIYNIINKLKAENTGIKVFLATIIPSYAYHGNTDYAAINEKIREIANATENVFLIDLNAYSACLGGTPYHNIHLTALGYNKMASEIKSLICYTIKANLEKFKEVQFIGTEYDIGTN
jgi:lysophospholipase L1-like esterase